MEELFRRIEYLDSKMSKYCHSEFSKLRSELRTKGYNSQNFPISKFRELESRLFREKFNGYENNIKDYKGETFQKGIIGITLEYFEQHTEELTDFSIKTLIGKLDEKFQGQIKLVPEYVPIHYRRIGNFTQQQIATHIAEEISAMENDWNSCRADLFNELKVLQDRLNCKQRSIIHSSAVVNNNTVTNGILLQVTTIM